MSAFDPQFLRVAIEVLDRLQLESRQRHHPLLASMIELAKVEAEDELRTDAIEFQRRSEFKDRAITASFEAELREEVSRLRKPPTGRPKPEETSGLAKMQKQPRQTCESR